LDVVCNLLMEYNSFVYDNFPQEIDSVKPYERTFLNLGVKHCYNFKGAMLLLNELAESDYLRIPLFNILRAITSDILTSEYLYSFLHDDLSIEQTTFHNELTCLQKEYICSLEYTLPKEQWDESIFNNVIFTSRDKLASRKELHSSSDKNLLTNHVLTGNMLSENKKYNHLYERKFEHNNYLINCLKLNKAFSQHYHYNVDSAEQMKHFSTDDLKRIYMTLYYSMSAFIGSYKTIQKFFIEGFFEKCSSYSNTYEKLRKVYDLF